MVKNRQLPLKRIGQIFLKILQKQRIVPASQKPQNIAVIASDVLKQVQKHRIRRIAMKQPRHFHQDVGALWSVGQEL